MGFQGAHDHIFMHKFHGIGVGGSSIIQVIHKSKYKQMQYNLSNCVPTVTVISRTFSGISFRVNSVIGIVVTQTSKLPMNLRNEVRLTMKRGVYAYSHRIIISSFNINCLCDLGPYGFPGCANTCMITFDAFGASPFRLVFKPFLFYQRLGYRFLSPKLFNAYVVVI